MEREIPPAPSAQEAQEYACRLQEVRNLAGNGRSKKRLRKPPASDKGSPSEAFFDEAFAEPERSSWQELLSGMTGTEEAGAWRSEPKGNLAVDVEPNVAEAGKLPERQKKDCAKSEKGAWRGGGRVHVRPPQRRRRHPVHCEAQGRDRREITLAVVVSAVTSFAVCMLMAVSQNGGIALLGKLLGSGWSM